MKNQDAKKTNFIAMPVVNQNAAGIDIGSRTHVVAIGQNKDADVREFGVYTEDLLKLADYLKENGIKTIALEATGGYQNPLVIILQEYDFEVIVTAGINTKNLKGKKTDVHDAMHIQQMHTLGLLPPCFVPNNFSMEIRSLVRMRRILIENASDYIKRMQKVLRNCNIRIDVAFSDTNSVSAIKIIEAILQGHTDGNYLAQFAHKNCKKSKQEIAKALSGNLKTTDLFQLEQCYRIYKNFGAELKTLDCKIEELIKNEGQKLNPDITCNKTKKKIDKNVPKFDAEIYACQIFDGINLDTIPAFGRDAILVFVAEIGQKISSFKSAKAFGNFLKLTPNHRVTGGKIKSNRSQKNNSLMSVTFRRVATAIGNMKDNNPLSNFFNKIKAKAGTPKAITATANKLARIMWTLFDKKENFDPKKLMPDSLLIKKKQIKNVTQKLLNLNLNKDELSNLISNITGSLSIT